MKATIKATLKAMPKAMIKRFLDRRTKTPSGESRGSNGNGKDHNGSGEPPGTELTQVRGSPTSVRMRGGARSGDELV